MHAESQADRKNKSTLEASTLTVVSRKQRADKNNMPNSATCCHLTDYKDVAMLTEFKPHLHRTGHVNPISSQSFVRLVPVSRTMVYLHYGRCVGPVTIVGLQAALSLYTSGRTTAIMLNSGGGAVHTLTCRTHIFLHITRAHFVRAYFAILHACHTHTHGSSVCKKVFVA